MFPENQDFYCYKLPSTNILGSCCFHFRCGITWLSALRFPDSVPFKTHYIIKKNKTERSVKLKILLHSLDIRTAPSWFFGQNQNNIVFWIILAFSQCSRFCSAASFSFNLLILAFLANFID